MSEKVSIKKAQGMLKLTCRILLFTVMLTGCKEKANPSGESAPVNVSGAKIYNDTATSTVRVFDRNGRVCIQQSNTYYELNTVYEGGNRIPLLFKIKKTELCYADSVNKSKVYEITAKSIINIRSVSWITSFVASNIQFDGNTLFATYEGGDNQEDFNRRFSLLSGKEVFSSSYGELVVKIPNVRERRFIGFTSKKAVTGPLDDLHEENLLGLIRYGSSFENKDAIKIKLKRSKVADKIPSTTPDMMLVPMDENTTAMDDGKTIVLMKTDEHYTPADVKNFYAKFTFYFGYDNESTEIKIPLVNDRLDLTQAKYDKDIFELSAF